MKYILLILSVFFGSFAVVHAQKEVACDIPAFVTDPSSGVNVRAGTGTNFKIVKTVPRDEGITMFDVVGSKDDWLKVAYAVNSKNEMAFDGTGWVFAPLLSVTEKHDQYKVYKSPSKNSKKIDIGLYDHILPLYGCQGEWAKVRLPVTGTGVGDVMLLGWMPYGTYCGNPWGACD
jgi:uncharacterized protein YraI